VAEKNRDDKEKELVLDALKFLGFLKSDDWKKKHHRRN
jgi:hypothetical protein